VDAFPDGAAPAYLLRDRDTVRPCVRQRMRGMRIMLARYFPYYPRARTHLSLQKDSPDGRPIERLEAGRQTPEVGGVHHRYARQAA